MRKEIKKVPTIRFRGFTEDWEQRKFGELAIRESETGISSQSMPGVEYADIISETGKLNKDISQKTIHKKGIKFDCTQVLYGKLRPYLHNWVNPMFKGIAVGDWWVLTPVKTDKNFLYRLIQTKQFDDVANQSVGSKMPRADWNLISDSEFAIPNQIKEQQMIGEYFSNLDNLITLHQRKFDELKTAKTYFLQNMFPAKGEKVPRIRFHGFTGDWEQRKLGEITKANPFKQYIAEGTLDGTYEVIQQGDTPVVGYADGKPFEDYEDVSLFGDHTLSLYKPKSPFFVASDGIKILSPSISINGLFYYYLLMRYKPHSEGYKRHYTILKSCEALYPTECEEQKKIGEYFASLDNLITLHQRKLNQLKTLKKFMLQNLFI